MNTISGSTSHGPSESSLKRKRGYRPEKPNKLPRLPITHKVTKRPLIHPSIPSPYASASSQKVVYVSLKTPFMSAVNRVRHLLRHVEKRDSQATIASVENDARHGGRSHQQRTGKGGGGDKILATALAATERRSELARKGGGEEIVIKGTGRAIEKVLGLAEFFKQNQQREGIRVVLRTGSVWAIDDVVPRTDEEVDHVRSKMVKKQGRGVGTAEETARDGDAGSHQPAIEGDPPDLMDVPDARLRQTSVLEVGISLC